MAEKKKGFSLGDALAGVLPQVSDSDTGREQIEYLDIALIDEDADNFYSTDGIEELAANIELVGLQQPLRVRPNPDMEGRYLIVSGHRRRRAWWALYEQDPERWAEIPCIVEANASSPAMQELRLIYANSDSRKMTSADLSRQAERVEMLLYQLKEEGVEFPGRMRDHVAEACKVSKTKLAQLKVIREKLPPELRALWDSGRLNESCAYTLAQRPEETQRLLKLKGAEWFFAKPEWVLAGRLQAIRSIREMHCPDGAACEHCAAREEYAITTGQPCNYYCCLKCHLLGSCTKSCAKAETKRNKIIKEQAAAEIKRKAELAESRKADEAARKEAEAQDAQARRAAWERVRFAAEAASVGAAQIAAAVLEEAPEDVDPDTIESVAQHMDGTSQEIDGWEYPFDWYEINELANLADLLHVSTDYLLGRAETPQPSLGVPQFRSGHPEEKTLAWCAFLIDGHNFTTSAVWWPHLGKWCFEHGASIEAECVGWFPLPDYKGVLRE